MSTAEAQLATVNAFCKALNTGDIPTLSSLLSSSAHFFHKYMPTTLGAAAQKPRNKADTMAVFRDTFESVVQHMGIALPPREVVQGEDKIMYLVEDRGVKKSGESYFVEYIMIFGFEKGGDKILSITEFQDSAYVNAAFAGWYKE